MTIVMASSTRENASRGQVCGVFVMDAEDRIKWLTTVQADLATTLPLTVAPFISPRVNWPL